MKLTFSVVIFVIAATWSSLMAYSAWIVHAPPAVKTFVILAGVLWTYRATYFSGLLDEGGYGAVLVLIVGSWCAAWPTLWLFFELWYAQDWWFLPSIFAAGIAAALIETAFNALSMPLANHFRRKEGLPL